MNNIVILGAAGFIGTNLTKNLAKSEDNQITVIDQKKEYFSAIEHMNLCNVNIKETTFDEHTVFENLVQGNDVVYHLISTTVPSTANQHIAQELTMNVVSTAKLLDACVKCGVKKIVFISSGGTVYGKEANCPLSEETPTYPINSYGIQKITIEKLLYLYHYMYGLDYRVIRLANPYGPYQRPNGVLGAVTTFTYKALKQEEIVVYGDGSVVRDFIYIDDAVRAIENIVNGKSNYKTFNLGCGYGTSIQEILNKLETILKIKLNVIYKESRKVDVPENYLDISRYENEFGKLNPISLEEGIQKTVQFMKEEYLQE